MQRGSDRILTGVVSEVVGRLRYIRYKRKIIRKLEQKHGKVIHLGGAILLDYYKEPIISPISPIGYSGAQGTTAKGFGERVHLELATEKGIERLELKDARVELYLKGESRYVDVYTFLKHPDYRFVKERKYPIANADYIDSLEDVKDYYRSLGGGLTRYEDFIFMNRIRTKVKEFEAEIDERMEGIGMVGGEVYDGYEDFIEE